jgi:hypothetical protein
MNGVFRASRDGLQVQQGAANTSLSPGAAGPRAILAPLRDIGNT